MKTGRFLSGIVLRLTLLFSVAIGLIRARPYDDGGLHDFLDPPSNCLAPCWNGIRPDFATYAEALSLLKMSASVRDLGSDMHGDNGHIFWKWPVSHPLFLVSTSEVSYASVEKNVIRSLYLPGFRSFLDTWFVLGVPDQIVIYSNRFWGIQNVIYLSVYPHELYVASAIFCSATPRDLWTAMPSVFIGQMPEYSALYPIVYERSDLKGWLPARLC